MTIEAKLSALFNGTLSVTEAQKLLDNIDERTFNRKDRFFRLTAIWMVLLTHLLLRQKPSQKKKRMSCGRESKKELALKQKLKDYG